MLGIGRHNRTGAGDPMSVAKVTGLFVLGAALISAVPTSINLLSHDTVESKPAVTTAPTATSVPGQPGSGLRFSPLVDGKLTVSGSTQKDVVGMYVVIGPKTASGGYDLGCGNVMDQQWQAEVATDALWPTYPLVTVPAYGSCVGGKGARPLGFAIQGTDATTSTPPPGQVVDCTKQYGPSCLSGPGFGAPTTYQPTQ